MHLNMITVFTTTIILNLDLTVYMEEHSDVPM